MDINIHQYMPGTPVKQICQVEATEVEVRPDFIMVGQSSKSDFHTERLVYEST